MKANRDEAYIVYILECGDQSLYTGITNDLEKRLRLHESGKGAKYTRGRAPYQVRYVEAVGDRSQALKREKAIKQLSRIEKWQLIRNSNREASSHVSPKEL